LARSQPDLPHDRPISYTREFRRCGQRVCSTCQRGGRGHGPYLYARWTDGDTRHKRYLGKAWGQAGRAGGDSMPPGASCDGIASSNNGAPLYVQTLGHFAVWRDGRPIPSSAWARGKAGILFKALLTAPSHRLTRAQAMDVLWPDPALVANPALLLRQVLLRLRRSLNETSPLIVDDKGTLVLDVRHNGASVPREEWLDAAAFDRSAQRALDDPDPASVRAALDLYHGPFLTDDAGSADELARVRYERRRLHDLSVNLHLHLARLMASEGNVGEAMRRLRDIQRQDPTNEATALQLMVLQAGGGEVDGALRTYEDLRDALREHRSAAPSRRVEELRVKLLEQRATPRAADRPPQGGGPIRTTNLPSARTSFVGRANERHSVQTELAGTRLLTLAGPGGCGKSRLALAVADDLVIAYPDGVWLVELAALADPVLVPVAIAAVLGVREETGRPMSETLAAFLAPRYLLLVLDNCERAASTCAAFADALLRAAPGLRILATSRIPLGMIGEAIWETPPMAVPPLEAPEDLARLTGDAGYDAVRLFVARARDIRARIAGPDAGRAVAEICRRLDGLPLAIELAAARLPLVPLREMPARLDDRLRLLGGGSPDALPHQQTLRAALDWSHALLNQAERTLFRRLAVFAGGWTPEMAAHVCAGEGLGGAAIPGLLEALTRQSLVQRDDIPGGGLRYRMLETIREYATERLGVSGEVDALQRRHAEEMQALALRAESELTGADQERWLARLEVEHDNLRAALRWTLANEDRGDIGDAGRALRLVGALWRFWHTRAYLAEGRRWIAEALGQNEGDDARDTSAWKALRAKAWRGAGGLAVEQGDYEAARQMYEAASRLYQDIADTEGIAASLNNLGVIADSQGRYAHAADLYRQSLALKRARRDTWGMTTSLSNLGRLSLQAGDVVGAVTLYKESLALSRTLEDTASIALSLNALGEALLYQGEYAGAAASLEESIALARRVGDKRGLGFALANLGEVTLARGDYAQAWTLQEESVQVRRELDYQDGVAVSLAGLGDVARARGDNARAAQLYGESLSLMQTSGDMAFMLPVVETVAAFVGEAGSTVLRPNQELLRRTARLLGALASVRADPSAGLNPLRSPVLRDINDHAIKTVRQTLGDDRFALAWVEQQGRSVDQVLAEAIVELRDDLQTMAALL